MIKQLLLIEDGLLGVYARLGPVTVRTDSMKTVTGRAASEKLQYQMGINDVN